MSRIYFDKNKLNKKQKLSASDYFIVNDSETLNDETKYILVSDLQNSILYPEVNTYADLPEASTVTDKIYVVLQATGTFGAYSLNGRCSNGSAIIDVRNILVGSNLGEAIVIQYVVIKAVIN